MLDMIYLEAYL